MSQHEITPGPDPSEGKTIAPPKPAHEQLPLVSHPDRLHRGARGAERVPEEVIEGNRRRAREQREIEHLFKSGIPGGHKLG